MHVENITSNAMSLDRNGQSMLIQVYEKEIERLNNIINELENFINNEIFTSLDKKHVFNEEADTFYKVLDKLKALKEE